MKRAVSVILVLIAILTGAGFVLLAYPFDRLEKAAVYGRIPTRDERLKQMQESSEQSRITLIINTTPYVSLSKKGRPVNWQIENRKENGSPFTVAVTLDESGRTVLETGLIEPGQYIGQKPLEDELEPGIYPCTAVLHIYDQESKKEINTTQIHLKLSVLE